MLERLRWPPQVLTHVREKLQHVQHQNAGLLAELGALDATLLTQREALACAKAGRLACSARAERLCGSSTAVLNPVLRADLLVCALVSAAYVSPATMEQPPSSKRWPS